MSRFIDLLLIPVVGYGPLGNWVNAIVGLVNNLLCVLTLGFYQFDLAKRFEKWRVFVLIRNHEESFWPSEPL